MAIVGTGITIDFASGFLAEIISVNRPDEGREAIETTHMGSVAQTWIPGILRNPGRLECNIAYDPTVEPPLDAAPETATITYPNGTTEAATAFMTGNALNAEIEERITLDVVIQFSGPVTRTPAP